MGSESKDWRELVAQADSLETVQAALSREVVIRAVMADSGESREVVADLVDATRSMGEEAVLDLTDGEPTTLDAGLQRYVAELEKIPELEKIGVDGVINNLSALLAYDWPGEAGRE